MKKYITVPNSEINFLKPDFECKLIRIAELGIIAEIKIEDEEKDFVIFNKEGEIIRSINDFFYKKDIKLKIKDK